ncbi:MAG: type I-E CRISPR-associated protein Cse2/CasB [bacterium]
MNQQTKAPPENVRSQWVQGVAEHLRRLAQDRGALAELRRGLGKEPAIVVGSVRRHVQRFMPADASRSVQDAVVVVATLFASHPEFGVRDMGGVLHAIDPKNETGSVERRFMALLNADPEDLPTHLRHAVSLAKSKGVNLDWAQLLSDLIDLFGSQDWAVQRVHRKWSRSFWATQVPSKSAAGEKTAAESSETITD